MNVRRWLSAWAPRFRDFRLCEHSHMADVMHQGGVRYLSMVAELADGTLIKFDLVPLGDDGTINGELAKAAGECFAAACKINSRANVKDMEIVVRRVGFTKFYGIWAPATPEYKLVKVGHPLDYLGRPIAGRDNKPGATL